MHIIPNIFILVAAYRLNNHLKRNPATLLGLGTGLVLAGISTLFMAGGPHGLSLFLVHAVTGMAVLALSFRLGAGSNSLLFGLINIGCGSAAAIWLPMILQAWILD